MKNDQQERQAPECPLQRLLQDIERMTGRKSSFFEHLNRSRVEFLKAVRALVDERIEDLEKKAKPQKKKKAARIEVE